jgi:uncharacterized protein DUF3467
MVSLARQDFVGAEELLEQDDSRELVRQRDRPERQKEIGPLPDALVEPARAADHEAEVPARLATLLEKARKLGAGQGLPLTVERAGERPLRHPPQERAFVPLPQLLHVDPRLAFQEPPVVGLVICERGAAQGSDADDQDPHSGILGSPTDLGAAMTDEGERDRHINMHMTPEVMGGVYANFANVSHSDYEFTLTFARLDHEVDDDEIPGVVVSRVNASPQFIRELIEALQDNYSKWSTREGIKNLPEYQGQASDEGDERKSSTT